MRRLARHLRRWSVFWLVALALLAASQAVWWWQTWPVRALLDSLAEDGL